MQKTPLSRPGILFAAFLIFFFIAGCNYRPKKTNPTTLVIENTAIAVSSETPLPTVNAPNLLTICMGQEPSSLFLYADSSRSARSIRQAIYDGPIDIRDYQPVPVILQEIPSLASGSLSFQPVEVQPGGELVDSLGLQNSLGEGVSFLPTGCIDSSCAVSYSGQGAVTLDQQVVKFRLKPGLKWADGQPLTADDSLFSLEVARSLFPLVNPDLLMRTQSYQVIDETTVEWRGIPGYRSSAFVETFFTPLPRHAWGTLEKEELLSTEETNRKPLGWGAYSIDEWTPGDHISLKRNPNYFRAAEGLPHFDRLVFRFTPDPEQALNALLAGECDYLDETNDLASQVNNLTEAQTTGKAKLLENVSDAWEHLDFGIGSLQQDAPVFFGQKETRQAFATCVDRQKIVDEVFSGKTLIPDTYISPQHPLADPQTKHYAYDPEKAATMLDAIGWRDSDGNPSTPRQSQAVPGVPDGSAFRLPLLVADDPDTKRIATLLVDSLAQCGIALDVTALPAEQLFSPGESSLIFGRKFDLAKFGWGGAWQPPCFLYTTREIPGPYPQFPKGWGGSNPSGYSNPDFDRVCQRAMATMPEQPEYQGAHMLAQSIFAQDLPSLPLYLHLKRSASRPDLCGVNLEPSAESALWNLESFQISSTCP